MRGIPFRLTIERLRTLVLVAAGLLIVALVASLTIRHWKNRLNLSEIPKKLGVDIEQEANGVTYTQSRGGRTFIKIHASKVVQLKSDGKALLHDVQIELYGEDGSRVDRIAGNEFEYDQKAGTAKASGPVEITLMKPGVAPAVAPNTAPAQAIAEKAKGTALEAAAQTAAKGQIAVKTSGLTFDQKSGTARTDQRLEFTLEQGTGSAVGAVFDSDKGFVELDHAVELNVHRGGAAIAETIAIHAQHAEFERAALECDLRGAAANYRNGKATAAESKLLFRQDGSVVRLDAKGGLTLATATGSKVAAPQGWLEFDEKNQPQKGHLEGGVTLDSVTGGRQSHGTAPVAELAFTPGGDLRHAHLETGVAMHSEEDAAGAHVSRDWQSRVADVEFKAASGKGAQGRMELASVTGQGGVVVSGQTRRGDGGMTPSRMAAEQVTALFGADRQLMQVVGEGHASMEQTTASGAVQTTAGDRVEAHFAPGKVAKGQEVESAVVDGNVVLTQKPAAKAGQAAQPALRATGSRAVYEGEGQWLHLTGSPWVRNGGMELTADKIDVAQGGKNEGDALAHGNVKASWVNAGSGSVPGPVGFGGQSPSHVIASEAEFHQGTGEATFKGKARLWQDTNSVTAPVIVLDRTRKTLVAHGAGANEPVRLALLSTGSAPGQKTGEGKNSAPAVVRVQGGELRYSDADRKAVLRAAPGGTVVAETGSESSNSQTVELVLAPAGSHAAKDSPGAQVERMTARGNVVLTSAARQGTGEQLVYTGQTGQYVLTGTDSVPPKLSDPVRGTVTGKALIFNSRDDSVRIEGAETRTTAVTHVPGR